MTESDTSDPASLHKELEDKTLNEAKWAAFRILINWGIVAADTIPYLIGEVPSWSADAAKFLKPIARRADITPDVSKKVAIGSEILELLPFLVPILHFLPGIFPSHIIEATLQTRHDIPRILEAGKVLGKRHMEERRQYFKDKKL